MWFWAAYLMTTATPGISATQLARQLGIERHETTWMMLHKLRRAMVNPERTLLAGTVEIDEYFVGGEEPGLRGGRARGDKALVVVAVEVRGAASGRVRMRIVHDASEQDPASVRASQRRRRRDGAHRWLAGLPRPAQARLHPRPAQPASRPRTRGGPGELLPRVHRVISNLKSWLAGTHHGVSSEHLPVYLDEYVFRFNRRRTPIAAFQTLLGLAGQQSPTTYHEITPRDPAQATSQRSQPGKHVSSYGCGLDGETAVRRAVLGRQCNGELMHKGLPRNKLSEQSIALAGFVNHLRDD
jgi:hypothetical protein